MIDRFAGDYDWLSNFYQTPISYNGITYFNAEAAFQAQKTLDLGERLAFSHIVSPGEAKRAGRRVTLRRDWESVKDTVMYEILKVKFSRPDLREKLLATGDEILVEGNYWNDFYWGVCDGRGQNMLGQILMRIRKELKD